MSLRPHLTRCSAPGAESPPGPREIPSAPAASMRFSTRCASDRRRLPAPLACCHAGSVPACLSQSAGYPAKQGHGYGEPELTFADRRLPLVAPTTSRRRQPKLSRLQTGHDRSPTWTPAAVMSPPPPGREDAGDLGDALSIHYTPDARCPSCPGPLRAPARACGLLRQSRNELPGARRPCRVFSRRSLVLVPLTVRTTARTRDELEAA